MFPPHKIVVSTIIVDAQYRNWGEKQCNKGRNHDDFYLYYSN